MKRWLLVFVMGAACRAPAPAGEGGRGARLVSLHDVTTEALVRMGAADRLAGIAELVSPAPEVRAALAGVRRVAGAESILALAPTAVVGLAVVAEQDPELVAALRARGIEVYLARPRTLDEVFEMVREVGRRVGAGAGAERAVAAVRGRVAAAPAPVGAGAGAGRVAPRLFVYDGGDPPFTAGGETVLSDLIARAGARNVFADLAAGWTHVSWEEVIAREPTHVVINDYLAEGGAAGRDQGWALAAALARKRATLGAMPRLAGLPVLALPLGQVLGGLGSADAFERLRALVVGSAG
jgi:iron complex transport system substrate-binding protein